MTRKYFKHFNDVFSRLSFGRPGFINKITVKIIRLNIFYKFIYKKGQPFEENIKKKKEKKTKPK